MSIFHGRARTFAAYDDTGVLLLQISGGAYRHGYASIEHNETLDDAFARAARALPRPIGPLVTNVEPLRSTITDAVYPVGISAKDAAGAAENDIDRSGFPKGVALTAIAQAQGASADGLHVTAGACYTETLSQLDELAKASGGQLEAAYHPAEAIAAALPASEAIVLVCRSYALLSSITEESFLARVSARSRADIWIKSSADTLRNLRQHRPSTFARSVTVVGETDPRALEAFAKEAGVIVQEPVSPQAVPEAGALWWLAHGLVACASKQAARVPLNYVRAIDAISDRESLRSSVAGATVGLIAFFGVHFLLAALLANASNNLASANATLSSERLHLDTVRGEMSASIARFGTAAQSIAAARDSGQALNAKLIQLGNLTLEHRLWVTGTLDVALDGNTPKIDDGARSMTDMRGFQVAADRASLAALWSQIIPVRAGRVTYLTFKVNQ